MPVVSVNRPTVSHDPNSPHYVLEFSPQILVSGDNTIFGVDCRLTYAKFVNKTGSTITVSVSDQQSTPIFSVPPTALSPNGYIILEPPRPGEPHYGGLVVNCSVDGLSAFLQSRPL